MSAAEAPREPLLTPRLAVVGLAAGLLSGLLGVGGGVVIVPLLVLWAGYGQREAHAWSLGAIVPIALAGVAIYGAAGEVRLLEALPLAAGALLGAVVGAGALTRLSESTLKVLFGIALLLVAAVMVLGE